MEYRDIERRRGNDVSCIDTLRARAGGENVKGGRLKAAVEQWGGRKRERIEGDVGPNVAAQRKKENYGKGVRKHREE